jgi:fucose permease
VRRSARLLLPLAFLAFASLGLPDAMLGVAWPSIRRTFGLPLSQLGVLLASALVGYLVSAFASGALVVGLGVGRLLLGSSVAMAASSLGYALAPGWPVMVALGLLSGLGAGAVDAGLNAFAATRFPPRTVSWLHACYGVGAALGPLILSTLMTAGWSWRWGYGIVALVLAGLTVCFALTVRRWAAVPPREALAPPGTAPAAAPSGGALPQAGPPAGALAALRRRPVQLNAALFLVYAGLEATAGQWSYSLLTESRGLAMGTAGAAVATYWGGLTAGRVLSGALARRHAPDGLLRAALVAAPLAVAGLGLAPGAAGGVVGLTALGLAAAPVYPLLISLTPARVGAAHAAHAVGFQVAAAYLGAAALPGLAGVLARAAGLEVIPPFLAVTALAVLGLNEVARAAGAPAGRPGAGRCAIACRLTSRGLPVQRLGT